MEDNIELYDVAIIGGGPGGMTAGIYSGRGLLKTLVIDKGALGGAVLLSERFDNFPGFPGGISSFELAQRMEEQLREYNVDIVLDDIKSLRFLDDTPLFKLIGNEKTYYAKSVILASGSTPRPLKAKGAKDLLGKGISVCAVCDGAFYRDMDVAVVGGGDSAVEEAIYLTKFVNSVRIIHRRDQLRARTEIANEAMKHPKISFVWDSLVEEVMGDDRVTGIKVRNVKTDEITELDVSGVFVYIGATGNTSFIDVPLGLDKWGYVMVQHLGETNIPGLYAIGDVRWEPYKQAIIACGQGAQAALTADKYIKTIPDEILEKYGAAMAP